MPLAPSLAPLQTSATSFRHQLVPGDLLFLSAAPAWNQWTASFNDLLWHLMAPNPHQDRAHSHLVHPAVQWLTCRQNSPCRPYVQYQLKTYYVPGSIHKDKVS